MQVRKHFLIVAFMLPLALAFYAGARTSICLDGQDQYGKYAPVIQNYEMATHPMLTPVWRRQAAYQQIDFATDPDFSDLHITHILAIHLAEQFFRDELPFLLRNALHSLDDHGKSLVIRKLMPPKSHSDALMPLIMDDFGLTEDQYSTLRACNESLPSLEELASGAMKNDSWPDSCQAAVANLPLTT